MKVVPEKSDREQYPAADPDRWVDEHGDYLYRHALIRVRTPEIAQDLVQDTFLAAICGRDKFAGRSSEKSWLCGILRNKIMDHYRRLGRETSFTDMDFLSGEVDEKFVADGGWSHSRGPKEWKPQVDVIMHRAEFWMTLRACMSKLPDRVADVFMLREMEEISSREICEMLSITESNLWVMLHRARMALRECLEINWFKKGGKS